MPLRLLIKGSAQHSTTQHVVSAHNPQPATAQGENLTDHRALRPTATGEKSWMLEPGRASSRGLGFMVGTLPAVMPAAESSTCRSNN